MIDYQILNDYYFNDAFLKARIFYVKLNRGINRTFIITFPVKFTYRECLQQLQNKIAEKVNGKFTN
jgi:hypothetical protein